jgi:Zn finger protein HypA/HybF involved in hydrogenase expression
MEPYIDPTDDKVYCSLCDKEMPNVTHFTKVQMKSMKQYRQKKSTSFSVKCQSCGKEDRPNLVNNDIVCPGCNKPHAHLSEPFKIMLREKLKTVGKDV